MSNLVLGNIFLAISILATASAQVVIKLVMADIPPRASVEVMLTMMLSASRIWQTGLFMFLVVGGFGFWVLCLNKLPLSYAYTLACSSALIVAALSVIILREPVTWKLWVGTLLISLGTAFVVSKG